MNDHPLNLLTNSSSNNNNNNNNISTINSNRPVSAIIKNEPISSQDSEFGTQSHYAGSNERQLTLANLFNSLSNFATSQSRSAALQASTASSNPQEISPPTYRAPPPSNGSSSLALTSSIQSVMAAAMMQQQLASAVSHQQQQPNPVQPPVFIGEQGTFSYGLQTTEQEMSSQQQQQRINYCTICNKELCNKYFMKTHMLKMHGINLEMEQPDDDASSERQDEADGINNERDSDNEGSGSSGQHNFQDAQQPSDCSSSNKTWSPPSNSTNKKTNPKKSGGAGGGSSSKMTAASHKKPTASSSVAQSSGKSQATSVMNGFAGNSMGGVVCDICNKELCSKYFLKVHKQNTHGIMTDYQDANHQFMYPFPNPLAAANPFLAPASTPIAGPFPPNPLNLFTGTQQQQPQQPQPQKLECHVGHEEMYNSGKKSGTTNKRARLSQAKQQPAGANLAQAAAHIEEGDAGARSGQLNGGQQTCGQFDAVYRLLLAQQQQSMGAAPVVQPPQPAPTHLMSLDPIGIAAASNPLNALMCFGGGPFGPAGMSPAMIVDNILRNQHLFNRNKNDTNAMSQQQQQQQIGQSVKSGSDRNNNNKSDSKQTSGKISSAKDAASNNSRYFTHYTEACPMCDRRFKSIKWLKTHMMNDHKQEIGAYMQMMMQYLYNSKSQQMAAAATMAAIEQQQQQQNLAHQLAKNQIQFQQQPQQPAGLLNKCFNMPTFPQQQQPQQQNRSLPNVMIDHSNQQFNGKQEANNNNNKLFSRNQRESTSPSDYSMMTPDESNQRQLHSVAASSSSCEMMMMPDFVIDARFRQESLSPGESLNRQSPFCAIDGSPSVRSPLGNEGPEAFTSITGGGGSSRNSPLIKD